MPLKLHLSFSVSIHVPFSNWMHFHCLALRNSPDHHSEGQYMLTALVCWVTWWPCSELCCFVSVFCHSGFGDPPDERDNLGTSVHHRQREMSEPLFSPVPSLAAQEPLGILSPRVGGQERNRAVSFVSAAFLVKRWSLHNQYFPLFHCS